MLCGSCSLWLLLLLGHRRNQNHNSERESKMVLLCSVLNIPWGEIAKHCCFGSTLAVVYMIEWQNGVR